MSRVCEICQKGKMSGHKVSHSNRKSNRSFEVNLQETVMVVDGKEKRVKACTKCMKTLKKVK
ncbi:MAG: 50S ribosomal protein L28 [Clostridia bacterium]|nr:50S ribosomal protein L28 [Clostridia bacterium]MDD4686335.1 50S ribosomal protein L28 [Clostridia bacterium]